MDMMRPVRLTWSPSLMSVTSPMSTAPTESSSRFSAMPEMLPGNSSSSPAMQRSRPCRRAIPSPTESTVPTSDTSTPAAKPPSCSRMILVISSARMSISSPLRGGGSTPPASLEAFRSVRPAAEVLAQRDEAGLHAAVVGAAVHVHEQAAEKTRVHARDELDVFAREALEGFLQGGFLVFRKCYRSHGLRGGHAAVRIP